jgi:alpha-D-xyloside xylohydrolase
MRSLAIAATALLTLCSAPLHAQEQNFVVERARAGRTIVIEPYAPNIVRITFSVSRPAAISPPGYGFVAQPSIAGWAQEQTSGQAEVFRSNRLVVRLSTDQSPQHMPLDQLNQSLRERYFGGGGGNGRPGFLPIRSRSLRRQANRS